MANYVWSRVVCSKNTLDMYFIDATPFGEETPLEKPYISFNKLFGTQSLAEYREKIGMYIYYGFGFSWTERDDGLYEIKFATRWEYPIQAIIRALELDHDIKWFAVEENCIYVSKFYWSNGVKEDVMSIGDDAYFEWRQAHMGFEDSLEDCDDSLWYYLQTVKECPYGIIRTNRKALALQRVGWFVLILFPLKNGPKTGSTRGGEKPGLHLKDKFS